MGKTRLARLPHRTALVAALALVGLPTLALPAAHWGPAAILLAGLTGTGAIGVEIMTEACGAAVIGYAALLLRGTASPAPALATDKVLAG